jgi:hypothetical protein
MPPLDDAALDQLFLQARTHYAWRDEPVDEEFFGTGKECAGCDQELFPEGHVRSNFLCNLGYGDPSRLFPRLPRLSFEEACSVL